MSDPATTTDSQAEGAPDAPVAAEEGKAPIPTFDDLAKEYAEAQLRRIVPQIRAAMLAGTPAISISVHERIMPHLQAALHAKGYLTKASEPRKVQPDSPPMPTFFVLIHATPDDNLGAAPTRVHSAQPLPRRPNKKNK